MALLSLLLISPSLFGSSYLLLGVACFVLLHATYFPHYQQTLVVEKISVVPIAATRVHEVGEYGYSFSPTVAEISSHPLLRLHHF
jgi:hypothetical protein